MIWDCFLFHDEVEMLECRLTELDEIVDRFVLIEGDATFQGKPKHSIYLDNQSRFAPWKDRIVPVFASLRKSWKGSTWELEGLSREAMAHPLAHASDDDLVLVSDVDEIPKAEVVRDVLHSRLPDPVTFQMRMMTFAVDWELSQTWRGTAARRGAGQIGSFQKFRESRGSYKTIPDAGWHLSWVGGKERQISKLESFSHTELAGLKPTLENYYTNGHHIDGLKAKAVEVDDSYPKYVRERRCPPSWFRPRAEAK